MHLKLVKSSTQVQSDLSSLAATVNSIQANIGSSVDAALADGLADINAAVAELEGQIDNIATGEDVDDINSTLEGLETDLDDLLASNNVFTGDLTINSEATLEFAESLGDKVKIVNGNVVVEAPSDLDGARLQTVVDKIRVITKDLTIRAANSSAPFVTLDSLSGVGNIKVAQQGSISFATLKSALEVTIGNNYQSKLDGMVNFAALTSVTKFTTGSIASGGAVSDDTANAIILSKASGINLGSLPYYTPRTLTLEADDEAALNLAALESKDANGKERSYTLSIKGALDFNVPGLTAGKITVEDVVNVNLAAFKGEITVNKGVENVTMGALSNDFKASSNDLVTVDLTADAADKSIDLTGAEGLLSATIAGKIEAVTLSGNNDLETVAITAALQNLTIDNTSLEEATLEHTNSNLVEKASLVVTGNEDLTSLTADNVDGLATLEITNNEELETISFASLKAVPTKADAGAKVIIGGSTANANALNAIDINQDAVDSDDGTFITDSGIDGLKDYLTAAAAVGASELKVYFDSADDFTDGTTPDTNLLIGTDDAKLVVVDKDPAGATANKSKRSFLITPLATTYSFNINGNSLSFSSTNSTTASFIAALNTPANRDAVTAYGATLTTSQYGQPEAIVAFGVASSTTISSTVTSATTVGTAQSVSIQLNKKDKTDAEYKATIYLSTAAITDLTTSTIGADGKTHVEQIVVDNTTTVASITDAIAAAFPAGTGVNDGAYTVTVSTTAASATLMIAAKDKSPALHGRGVKVSISSSLSLGGDATINLATNADDTLLGTLPVVTFESNTAGTSMDNGGLSTIGNPGETQGTSAGELMSAGTELTRNASGDQDQDDSPTDYVNYGTETEPTASAQNRIGWL